MMAYTIAELTADAERAETCFDDGDLDGIARWREETDAELAATCERCGCLDFRGSEGVRSREDVTLNGKPAVLCDFCHRRVSGAIPDPLAAKEEE